MRGKLAAWLRAIAVVAALTAFALALFNALPREVPDAWRGWIALLAVAAILGAGLDLLLATLRDRRRAR